jgi:mannose/fructose/N-acetylgalactosamine-specific phosphotransferase system component IIB
LLIYWKRGGSTELISNKLSIGEQVKKEASKKSQLDSDDEAHFHELYKDKINLQMNLVSQHNPPSQL